MHFLGLPKYRQMLLSAWRTSFDAHTVRRLPYSLRDGTKPAILPAPHFRGCTLFDLSFNARREQPTWMIVASMP